MARETDKIIPVIRVGIYLLLFKNPQPNPVSLPQLDIEKTTN
jgi:hypothetical protein